MSKRRFFSGRTLEQAILEAARHHALEPDAIAYRLRDGGTRAQGKVVIEVDAEAPDQVDGAELAIVRTVEQVLGVGGLDVAASLRAGPGEGGGGEVVVDLGGPDLDLLWENEGEVLAAVEVLAGLVLWQEEGRLEWMLDAGGRRLAQAEELRRRARQLAAEVREKGAPIALEPQTPGERRIVHLALRDEPGVETESEGHGPGRCVRILPRDDVSGG